MYYSRVLSAWLMVFFGLVVSACSGEPKTFDECILKYINSGLNEAAVRAIQKSCNSRFSDRYLSEGEVMGERELSSDELAQITGRAGIFSGTLYSGVLHNGNAGLKVTSVRFRLTTKTAGKAVEHEYKSRILISPFETSKFSFEVIIGDDQIVHGWSVVEATGIAAK